RVMDGEKPDLSSLTEEEIKYVKTVKGSDRRVALFSLVA
ncbi:unnamed protein product, partial [marine sediment metagenome]